MLSEPELRKLVRKQCGLEAKNISLLNRVRIAFWEEYERAARIQETMVMNNLFRGVCRNNLYWALYSYYPALLAWVICPLAGYLLQRKELEFLAEERMIEIMSTSAVKDDGKVDSRLAKVQFEMYQSLQDRLHGPVVQKVQSEQKNLNVNVEATPEQATLITDPEQLARRLEEVRKKREALSAIHQPVQIDTQKLVQPIVIEEK